MLEKTDKKLVYLDNSATTRQYDAVTETMLQAMRENYGNPSSLHALGLAAEKEVRAARKTIAAAIGAKEETLYFTACGTESDNTVLFGAAQAKKRSGKKILVSAAEHPAILEPARKLESLGYEVVRIGVDRLCHPDMNQLAAELTEDTILISIMGVNNETGTIMPIPEIAKICGYVPGDRVTAQDVEKLAHHIPEANAFQMTEEIARRNYDGAAAKLAELFAGDAEPIEIMGVIGWQVRQLYAAKIAEKSERGVPFLMEILGTSSEYRARKIAETAAKFSLPALTNGVRLCAECAMKPRENGAITDAEAIKEFLIRFAMESRRA